MKLREWEKILLNSDLPWYIVFVCSGNIMRSPYAMFQAQKCLQEKYPQLTEIIVFRSGAVVYQNRKIHEDVKQRLIKEDFDPELVDNHIPRKIQTHLDYYSQTNLFFVMTREHKKILENFYPGKSFLLSEIINSDEEISDPYFNPQLEDQVFSAIKSIVQVLCERLKDLIKLKESKERGVI